MNTPIFDFVRNYAEKEVLRMHMPGHKGAGVLGLEHLDITEIDGADSLYEAGGIIRQSEENASALFGCRTLFLPIFKNRKYLLFLSFFLVVPRGLRDLSSLTRN